MKKEKDIAGKLPDQKAIHALLILLPIEQYKK
jgi:hypothetical protein